MSQPTIISTEKLSKSYGKNQSLFKALQNIDLNIKSGESIAIVGKSGSGKSTLMHLLALMDKPTSGSVHIDNKDISELSKHEQDLLRNRTFGFVFQQFFLNGNATVLENVILPLKIAGVSSKERKNRGIEVLKAVDLGEKIYNKANNLSGGEKQRVVIARALVNNPRIIFADEPTGNLDSTTGKRIEKILFDNNKNNGITLIIVTHDSDLALMCDRQIYIKDGNLRGEQI